MAQSDKALNVWEKVLETNDFKRIIDIGTYRGTHSLYLLLYCLNKGVEFYTYDIIIKWKAGLLKKILNFGKHFNQWDVFQHISEIGELIKKEGVSIVFCDGNEKTKEFNTFAPFLKVGDVLAIHDWKTYAKPEDVEESIKKYKLKEIFGKECDEEEYLRFFVRNE